MSDVIAWFREQLDQDEAVARRASAGPWTHSGDDSVGEGMIYGQTWNVASVAFYPRGVANSPTDPGYLPAFPTERVDHNANADHITRWDPAAVLGDIAAKRAVLDLRDEWHENLRAWQVPEGQTRPEHLIAAQGWYQALTHAVALLAQAYAGRPGFDPSWRTG